MSDPSNDAFAPDPRWPFALHAEGALAGRLVWSDAKRPVVPDSVPEPAVRQLRPEPLLQRESILRVQPWWPPIAPDRDLDVALRSLLDWPAFGAPVARTVPICTGAAPLVVRHLEVCRALVDPPFTRRFDPCFVHPVPLSPLPGGNIDRFLLACWSLYRASILDLRDVLGQLRDDPASPEGVERLLRFAYSFGACPGADLSRLPSVREPVVSLPRGFPRVPIVAHSISRAVAQLNQRYAVLVQFANGVEALPGIPLAPYTRRSNLSPPARRLECYQRLASLVLNHVSDALRMIAHIAYLTLQLTPGADAVSSDSVAAALARGNRASRSLVSHLRRVSGLTALVPPNLTLMQMLFVGYADRMYLPYLLLLSGERAFVTAYLARAARLVPDRWGVPAGHDHPLRSGPYCPFAASLLRAVPVDAFSGADGAPYYGRDPFGLEVHRDPMTLGAGVREGLLAFAVRPVWSSDLPAGSSDPAVHDDGDPVSERVDPGAGAGVSAAAPAAVPDARPASDISSGSVSTAGSPAVPSGGASPPRSAPPPDAQPAADRPAAAPPRPASDPASRVPDPPARPPPRALGEQAPPRIRSAPRLRSTGPVTAPRRKDGPAGTTPAEPASSSAPEASRSVPAAPPRRSAEPVPDPPVRPPPRALGEQAPPRIRSAPRLRSTGPVTAPRRKDGPAGTTPAEPASSSAPEASRSVPAAPPRRSAEPVPDPPVRPPPRALGEQAPPRIRSAPRLRSTGPVTAPRRKDGPAGSEGTGR